MIFTAAAPSALENIGAYYYLVFVCLTAIQIGLVLVLFPDVSRPCFKIETLTDRVFPDKGLHPGTNVGCFRGRSR